MMLEVIIQAVIYTTTIIATLRAGSRAIYAMSNDEIGMMDGPLILSPQDISEIREQGSLEGDISPLWESTFGFSEAVRLLHDESQLTSDVRVGNWKEEAESKQYYSMAAPHKSREKIHSTTECSRSEVDELSTDHKNETRLVVVEPKEVKYWRSTRLITKFKDKILSNTSRMIEGGKAVKTICVQLLKCHPLFEENFFSKHDEEDVEDDNEVDEDLDFDVFYSTTVKLPTSRVQGESMSFSDDENAEKPKVAHIKAYAPDAFTKLRSRFQIPEEDFLSSLLRSGPYISFQSNSKGAARVGGFFFFSRDGAYMVKTIKVSCY